MIDLYGDCKKPLFSFGYNGQPLTEVSACALVLMVDYNGLKAGQIFTEAYYDLDSGYSVYVVEVDGQTYKPFQKDVATIDELNKQLDRAESDVKRLTAIKLGTNI